jgi:hypothetical protein
MKKVPTRPENPASLPVREDEMRIASLRAAIDQGFASGIAKPGVFPRIRMKHGLPQRNP